MTLQFSPLPPPWSRGDSRAAHGTAPQRSTAPSTLEARATSARAPRATAGTVRRSSRAIAPMINRLGPVAGAEAVDHRGRLLIAGYAVKRLSASLSPRDRRESGRAVPRGAHRARSALSASRRESAAAARAARETLGLLGRNGEAPSDRSLGASVYRPSPKVRDERKWLRIRRRLLTRSRGSRRDGFAPLAASRKCERMRIQVVGRQGPGRSLEFAPSREERRPGCPSGCNLKLGEHAAQPVQRGGDGLSLGPQGHRRSRRAFLRDVERRL